jgi:hypothetical protein
MFVPESRALARAGNTASLKGVKICAIAAGLNRCSHAEWRVPWCLEQDRQSRRAATRFCQDDLAWGTEMKTSKTLAVWAFLFTHSHAWAQPVRIETGVPPAATSSPEGLFLKGAEEQGVKLASELGATSLEALRKLEPEQFLKHHDAGTMHPIIDGYVLAKEPFAAFAAGRQNDVPILIGSNAGEGRARQGVFLLLCALTAISTGQSLHRLGRRALGRAALFVRPSEPGVVGLERI